jgi:hypothetical protein
MRRILLTLVMLFASIVAMSAQQLHRLPLQKRKIELKSPVTWEKSLVKVDPKTQKEIYHDPKPRLEVADAKAGKYYMKWIGYDEKEKTVIYQRPDCVEVVVIASANKSKSGGYEYQYTIQNLETSGDYLNGFAVQNYSADMSLKNRPTLVNNVLVDTFLGGFGKGGLSDGNWIRFAPVPPHSKVMPGQSLTVNIGSSAPPGLVECRVNGGDFVIKGVGEELPQELEALILDHDVWPRGYTIGAIDDLKKMSRQERISYLLKVLPQCKRQGWIAAKTLTEYEQLLKQGNLQGIIGRVANDLKARLITSEIFSIIQAMGRA